MKKSAQTVIREGACYTIAAANGRVLEVADFNTENGAHPSACGAMRVSPGSNGFLRKPPKASTASKTALPAR